MYFDRDKIKQQLLEFTIQAVEKFLKEHPELEFYAFAYDCNAEYAEVNLCLNTQDQFKKTLHQYQSNEFSDHYQTIEQINTLKFNTGDWKYQCFDTIYILDDPQLNDIYGELPEDDGQSWHEFVESLMLLFSESLLEFTQTDTYKAIPKTQDFIAYAIDHDEDFNDAITRMFSLTSHTFVDAPLKYAELNDKFKMYTSITPNDAD